MGKKRNAIAGEIATLATRARELLLVCDKCGRKLKRRGFGEDGRDALADALKHELRARGARGTVRIVAVGCLGVCPRNAVTVLRGAAPGELMIVPAGLDLGASLLPRLGFAAVRDAEAGPGVPAGPDAATD